MSGIADARLEEPPRSLFSQARVGEGRRRGTSHDHLKGRGLRHRWAGHLDEMTMH